jgi:pimeloyl-ACP methyl ester carboxylesterase
MRRRISATRWPDREVVTDESQGVQLATIQKLARYWASDYDWRKCEARLNAYPQFITEIDGLDIHFIHVRSKHDDALPLIVTHGWPGSIIEQMKIIDPLTNPSVVPADVTKALLTGQAQPSGLSADERRAYEQLDFVYKHIGYGVMLGTHPQSLTGLADSPVGLAAFLLDHDLLSYKMIARAFDGQPTGLTRDDVLDNVTLFWLTNTGVSSGRLYWENKLNFFDVKNVTLPVAVSVFPEELYETPRTWAEKAYPKLVYYNKVDKGGHFAAWEQPKLFSEEVRAGFRSLR